jgi:hypothetical protein
LQLDIPNPVLAWRTKRQKYKRKTPGMAFLSELVPEGQIPFPADYSRFVPDFKALSFHRVKLMYEERPVFLIPARV